MSPNVVRTLVLIVRLYECFGAEEVRHTNDTSQLHDKKLTYTPITADDNRAIRLARNMQMKTNNTDLRLYPMVIGTSAWESHHRKRRSISPAVFRCDYYTHLPIEVACNGVYDCSEGQDERDCQDFTCPTHYARCDSGPCYRVDSQCDTIQNCPDNSDEIQCHNATCPSGYFRCNSGQCVLYPDRCNGVVDCADRSDESDCVSMSCPDEWFRCADWRCMSRIFVCEYAYRLTNKQYCSAEFEKVNCDNYTCIEQDYFQCSLGQCLPKRFRCNGVTDCPDGLDERLCDNNTCTDPSIEEFLCDSGQCIPMLDRCDRYEDCFDGSDEENCSSNDCGRRLFTCPSGQCILKIALCDRQQDCIDGADESICDKMPECSESEYRCQTGHCLPIAKGLCNGYFAGRSFGSDCPTFHDDEKYCAFRKCPSGYLRLETGGCRKVSPNISCPLQEASNRCPSSSYIQCSNCRCVHRVSICDGISDCPDGKDERHCGLPDCREDQFYCGNTTCFPLDLKCDGFAHCPGEHDEIKCKLNQTIAVTKTTTNNNARPSDDYQQKCYDPFICLTAEEICFETKRQCQITNNHSNCFVVCPEACECNATGSIKCNHWSGKDSLNGDPEMLWPTNGSNFIFWETLYTFFTFQRILMLSITKANLTRVPSRLLTCAFNIHHLDLSNNLIDHIIGGDFGRLYRLSVLDLSNNLISSIEDFSFKGLRVFRLKLESNIISGFGADLLSGMALDGTLVTDEFRFCCLLPSYFPQQNCFPKPDQFSSCKDLMKNEVLGAFLWLIGFVALIGNSAVLLSKVFVDRESLQKNYGVLVTNLAAADVLMAFYLLSIASVDTYYRGSYATNDAGWRNSPWCSLVGVICMISSEGSVFFICLITIDRYLIVKYPFGQVRISRGNLARISVSIWISAVTLAVLPLAVTPYFKGKFFSKSGVCIALPLTTDEFYGWQYSFAINVCLNFILFLIVFVGQILIYKEVRLSQKQSLVSTRRNNDSKIAIRLMFVVLSDFLCWIPIGVMGIMTISGFKIPADVYAWVIVLVIPINSALNPYLYTAMALCSAYLEERNKAKGAQTAPRNRT